MKKLKLLLIGLFCLIGLSSFCSAFQKIDLEIYGSSSNRVAKPSSVSMPYVICGSNGITLYTCMNPSSPACNSFTFAAPSSLSSWGNAVSSCYYYNYTTYDVNQYLYASADTTISYYVLTDCSDSGSSCDYSSYESEISTLSGNLALCKTNLATYTGAYENCQNLLSNANSSISSLSGNLATCNSNLATATGNLATCQSDLINCQNSSSNSSCESTGYISDYIPGNILFSGSKSFSSAGYTNMFNYGDYGAGTYCLKFSSTSPQTLSMGFANGGTTAPTNLYSLYNDQYGNWICLYGNKPYLNVKLNSSNNTIDYEVYKLTDLLDSQFNCPVSSGGGASCDTGSILSGYILESSINQIYCVNNGLCPSCPIIDQEYCENNFNLISPSNCPVCSGGVSNWSSLWINNIQHLGASSIYMSIPEEIDRDYSYSNSGEIMEIDVEGYNVDYDYINGVVDIQKYKPSSEDFTNIVSNLGAYFKILLFLVFAFLIIRRVSKPFRSKIK